MTSNMPSPPAGASSPDADRAGPAVPANIAALLYVVGKLLEFGRHLAATIERRAAAPGFWLFAAVFGTANVRVILAHLHRGILRATALESLLLKRAATGRDVEPAPIRIPAAPGENTTDDPLNEPFKPQVERLAAARARYDAPIDPENLPTLEQIEAEVRDRPMGRTIAAICRDFGIIPGMCTREFWDSLITAIACYEGSAAALFQDMQRRSEEFQHEQEQNPEMQQMAQGADLYPHQTLGFRLGEHPVDPFRDLPAPLASRHDVPVPKQHAAAPAEATGPPPSFAALQRAA